jgi:hypothetical protein
MIKEIRIEYQGQNYWIKEVHKNYILVENTFFEQLKATPGTTMYKLCLEHIGQKVVQLSFNI